MNRLQKSLSYNAIFSGTSGILLIGFPWKVAEILAASNSAVLFWIGVGLIVFTVTLLYEIRRQNPLGILIIIGQDFLWVLSSILLLIWRPFGLSTIGYVIIAFVALIVFVLAINQAKALSMVDATGDGSSKRLDFERTVPATREKVWRVIADVGNYHRVAPNIDSVTILSGAGHGTVRRCSHGTDRWTEQCTLWEEGKGYAFEVDTQAADYPYPFQSLRGRWSVEPEGASRTQIHMQFDFQYRKSGYNWLLHPLLRVKFIKTAEELLDNWQKEIEKEWTRRKECSGFETSCNSEGDHRDMFPSHGN